MSPLVFFGLIALTGLGLALAACWAAGRNGAAIAGAVITLLGGGGALWAWVDAQSKTGFDALASGLMMAVFPVFIVGYWLGIALARWRGVG